MTTIAYRDGVLAADSLAIEGGLRAGHFQKVFATPRGILCGACGSCEETVAFVKWVKSGCRGTPPKQVDEKASVGGIIVSPDGRVDFWDGGPAIFEMTGEFFAIGTGREIAMGAMAFGASAVQAVEVAIGLDIHSGGKVEAVSIHASTATVTPLRKPLKRAR